MTQTQPQTQPQPQQDRRFPTLNAVRAVGALMVVCTHAAFNTGRINQGWAGAALARLDFGVALFFILSGFLLARPFLMARALGRPAPSGRHYLWKRALRILPLYWVVVFAAMTLDPANADATWQDWLANLTLTQLYRHALLSSSLTQMWSLCTEVAFYLVLPLLVPLVTLALTRRRGSSPGNGTGGLPLTRIAVWSSILSALGLVWIAAVAPIPGYEGHYAQWLPGYLPWFLVGIVFAAFSASLTVHPRPHLLQRWGSDLTGCWVVATAFFALSWTPIAGPRNLVVPVAWEAVAKVVLYGVAAGFYFLPLVFGPEQEGWVRRHMSSRPAVWLGDISYGVFAIHMLVLNMVFLALDLEVFTGHFLLVLGATLGITVPLATLSFYFFEKPILRMKNSPRVTRYEPRVPAQQDA